MAVLNLQQERLSKAYRGRLAQSYRDLARWCKAQGFSLSAVARSPEKANSILIDFIQWLFKNKQALWKAVHAGLALQTVYRALRGNLRAAWDSILSWKLMSPVRSRLPLPEMLMLGLCRYAVLAAAQLDRPRARRRFAFQAMLRIRFYALLRPKEIWNLKRCHVRYPGCASLLSEPVGVLMITEPKNRAFLGRRQVRLIRDQAAVEWLRWIAEGAAGEEALWRFSPHLFRQCLRQSLSFFGLEQTGFTVASLRAGQATALLEKGWPVANIKLAGCWSSDRALSAYL